MYQATKFKRISKILILGIIFTLLSISIANSLIKIYAVSSQPQPICVPIIMYHQVKTNKFGKDVISPYEFESDLKYLSENNYSTITMGQLIDYVYESKELPPNPIILTFDDGYLNTYKYVYPLLKQYNMKIVLSIIGGDTDNFSRAFDDNIDYAHMTWNQLNEMGQSGFVEIQNHSYNLHTCKGRIGCKQKANESLVDYEKLMTDDIYALQEKIKLETGNTPSTFTYPYGEVSENTDLVIKKLGFKATLSCKYGVNLITKDPEKLFRLKRICRSHNQGVKKLIKEGLETLKYIDKKEFN
jgi:peptidoglycan/xylan/chitin deacetylase (PgdA/CDA1 family)